MDSFSRAEADADSAEYLCHRLVHWTFNAPYGVAYIAYEGDVARRHLEARWKEEIRERGLTVDHLDLGSDADPMEAIETLQRKIRSTTARVLSVTGFGPFLDSLEQDWTRFNYRREEWFDRSVLQVWWVPARLDEAFRRLAPDTYDWFLVRGRLAEEDGYSLAAISASSSNLTPPAAGFVPASARRRSDGFLKRFQRAYLEFPVEDLAALIVNAAAALFEASLNIEAHDRVSAMLDRIEFGPRSADWSQRFEESNSENALVATILNLATLAVDHGDVELGERVLAPLSGRDIEYASPDLAALYYLATAAIDQSKGELELAERRVSRAMASFREMGEQERTADCLLRLAGISVAQQDLSYAKHYLGAAERIYAERFSSRGIANCQLRLGEVSLLAGEFKQAAREFRLALSHFESSQDRAGLANCLSGLGAVAFSLCDYSAAEEWFRRALPIYRQLLNLGGEAVCLRNLGMVAMHRLHEDLSRAIFQEAAILFREARRPAEEADCLLELGKLAFFLGSSEDAQNHFVTAERLFASMGNRRGVANAAYLLAQLDLDKGDAETAEGRLKSANLTLALLDNDESEAECIHALADADFERGRFDAAIVKYNRALPGYALHERGILLTSIAKYRLFTIPTLPLQERRTFRDSATRGLAVAGRTDLVSDFVRAAAAGVAGSKRAELRLLTYVREQTSDREGRTPNQ